MILWVRVFDPRTQSYYYHHKPTGHCQSRPPEQFISAQDDPLQRAVILVQSILRGRAAQSRACVQKVARMRYDFAQLIPPSQSMRMMTSRSEMDQLSTDGVWLQLFDPVSKKSYYYHSLSRSWTWNVPSLWIPGHRDVLMRVVLRIQAHYRAYKAKKRVVALVVAQKACRSMTRIVTTRGDDLKATGRIVQAKHMTREDSQSRCIATETRQRLAHQAAAAERSAMATEDRWGHAMRYQLNRGYLFWNRAVEKILTHDRLRVERWSRHQENVAEAQRRSNLEFIFNALELDRLARAEIGLSLIRAVSRQRRKARKKTRTHPVETTPSIYQPFPHHQHHSSKRYRIVQHG